MSKFKSSEAHEELTQLLNIMKEQTSQHTLPEYISKYPDWLVRDVKDFLSSQALTSLTNGDYGCYDATVVDEGTEFFVEVTLDENGYLEDCYCTCNTGFCLHLAAVLWKINDEINPESAPLQRFLN